MFMVLIRNRSLVFGFIDAAVWLWRWRLRFVTEASCNSDFNPSVFNGDYKLSRCIFQSSNRGTMMQAAIGSSLLPTYRERFTAGTMFSVSGFDVSRCAQNFRLTDSPLMIRFTRTPLSRSWLNLSLPCRKKHSGSVTSLS
ncbi:Uncharacterized protein Rs2_29654 [Raphanus sativus]|uniref:Uncharacterized protein LOC108807415 n=1 Tax=Raphanus sativus TaxID=3726 RepID=A0A6J0JHT4_RAPSA|nr:uncharacterized protein LOC108807415 [Raphanus sativus]KAJ4889906.1 Uncharacterized protein Rs2_29654 [Raphanus sativus]